MKYKLFTLIITAMTITNNLTGQQIDFLKVKKIERQLDDIMELIDTAELKAKFIEVEQQFQEEANEINNARLGIIYHEVALNFSFLTKTRYKGYAKKSYDKLSDLFNSPSTTPELMPFIASYRASALSLVVAETKELKLLGEAFTQFEVAVNKYATVSYLPEFLRASVAENLPWFFFSKRKFAKMDLGSIISKQNENAEYANWKIMSFTYWAWANQYKGKKYREQALTYLDRAIELDPDYKAGRSRAEELKVRLSK